MSKNQGKSELLKAENSASPVGYVQFLNSLKEKIRSAQLKAALSVNQGLIKLCWEIGKEIAEKQESGGWGSKMVERIGQDLQNEFPDVEGFSRRNLFRMRSFYLAYQIVPQAVAQLELLPVFRIPWGHNALLLERVKDAETRLWYAEQAIENGWSRSVLETWIDSNLHRRKGKAITNFKASLPESQSDIAEQITKMNFYLSAVDNLLRQPGDQPSIGILLCKTKNKVKVEYALRNCNSPISVSSYETKIVKSLPKKLKSSLPTVEAELSIRKKINISPTAQKQKRRRK